ncbi:MAG: site-specific integrase [Alphaproteobacteria bacterium]
MYHEPFNGTVEWYSMGSVSYLIRRNGVYSFRIAIPKGLQQRFQAHELKRSLRTSHVYEAKERATTLLTSVRDLFRVVEMSPDLTLDQIKELTRQYFHEVILPRYEAWKANTRTANRFDVMPSSPHEEHPNAPTVEQVMERIIHPNGYPEGDFLFAMADAVLERYKIDIDHDSNAYKELAVQGMGVIRDEITGLISKYARHTHNPEVFTNWLKPVSSTAIAQTTMNMSQLFAKYEQMNGAAYGLSMKQTHHTALAFWIDVFGDTRIDTITRVEAVKCEEALRSLPANWKKSIKYRGKSIEEMRGLEIPLEDKASAKTINDRLAVYSKMFAWAAERAYYKGENPFKGLGVKQMVHAREQRLPYTLEQLRTIFSSPVYVGCKSKGRRSTAGNVVIWDSLYWLPIMSLFTGARMNELCQLHLNDVKEVNGVWVIVIHEDAEDQRVKTTAGKRMIPIHPKLIELGLLDYKAKIAAREDTRLFPDIALGSRETYAGVFTRTYAHYIDDGIELERDKRQTFHSYRHCLTGKLRDNDTRLDVSKAIIGHEDGDVHSRYGGSFLVPMKAAIDKVTYDLDWELLMRGKPHAKLIREL